MTLNVLRRRGATVDPIDQPEIGDADSEIFSCPGCQRPLAVGTARCPGCRMRLVVGVPVGRASSFVVIGLLSGIIVGALGSAGIYAIRGTAAVEPGATLGPLPTTPGGVPGTSVPPSSAPSATMPGIVASALDQAALVNLRIANAAVALEAALSAGSFDAQDSATLFRTLASEAAFGSDLVSRSASWRDAQELSRALGAFYAGVRQEARDALRVSVSQTASYRASSAEMVRLIVATLPPVDAHVRSFGLAMGLELPALPVLPEAPAPTIGAPSPTPEGVES
jgi:hypothetical protein